jgi:hypothetical protein
MVRLAALISLAGCTFGISPLSVGNAQSGPICRVPTVLDVMAHEVRNRDYYGRINPDYVAEQPNGSPNIVRCTVAVRTLRYDWNRFGRIPEARVEFHDFVVEAVRRGFVVRYIR